MIGIFSFTFNWLYFFGIPVLKTFSLVHEGFEAGQCIRLFLTIIGHIEDGNIVILLSVPFKKGTDNRPGHAGKRHDINDAACTPFSKVD